ncbi:MAG: hypothetical protein D6730_07395 [Bacteroidetes bacterium]|nr:MAG: hypothetical protein D6730_07395 [Bacteroidota bacterium]
MKKKDYLRLAKWGVVLLVVIGLVLIGVGGQTYCLSCTRQASGEVHGVLQRYFLGLFKTKELQIPAVSAALLKSDCSDACVYWLELMSEGKGVRLSPHARYHKRRVAQDQQQIEQFLLHPSSKSFEQSGQPSWLMLFCALPMVVVGGLLLLKKPGSSKPVGSASSPSV